MAGPGPVPAIEDVAPDDKNLPCSGMICFSFMTLLGASKDPGRLGRSEPWPPTPLPLALAEAFSGAAGSSPEPSARVSSRLLVSRSRRGWCSVWRWRSSSSLRFRCCCW